MIMAGGDINSLLNKLAITYDTASAEENLHDRRFFLVRITVLVRVKLVVSNAESREGSSAGVENWVPETCKKRGGCLPKSPELRVTDWSTPALPKTNAVGESMRPAFP